MQGFLTKIAALVAAAMLALPPGICCGMSGFTAQEMPAAANCCHQAPHSPAEQQAPAQPTTNCCCTVKAATTSSTVQSPEPVVTGFLAIELLSARQASEAARFAAPAVVFTGPPLRILQCVWRI